MTWQTFQTISYSIIVHVRVSVENIHFSFIYITDHILPVLPIKRLVNQDSEPTTTHKLETDTKPSVSNPRVLFCMCVVLKATAHVYTKELNICHQSQKNSCGIFVGIPQHQKGYLIYVFSTWKLVSSHDVVFDEKNLVS